MFEHWTEASGSRFQIANHSHLIVRLPALAQRKEVVIPLPIGMSAPLFAVETGNYTNSVSARWYRFRPEGRSSTKCTAAAVGLSTVGLARERCRGQTC